MTVRNSPNALIATTMPMIVSVVRSLCRSAFLTTRRRKYMADTKTASLPYAAYMSVTGRMNHGMEVAFNVEMPAIGRLGTDLREDAPYKAQLRTEIRRVNLRTVSLPCRGRHGAADRHGDRLIDRARHGTRRRPGAIDPRIAATRGNSDLDRAGRIVAGQLLPSRAGGRRVCANSDGTGQS